MDRRRAPRDRSLTPRRWPGTQSLNPWARVLEVRRERGLPVIDLTESNPTRVGLAADAALQALQRAVASSSVYDPDPQGIRTAREAVAARAAEWGARLDAADVILTASTSEAYAHLIRLLADPGDEILVPRPSYPLVEPIATAEGVRVRAYDLDAGEGWRPDLESLGRIVGERTRAIVVIQPNNPTGTWLDERAIDALDELAAERGIALVSDEVFAEFPWAADVRRTPTFLGERRSLTFVLDGISKSCGLPQMKLAWIALAGPRTLRAEAMRRLTWIADLFLSVSTPAQQALPEWLASRGAFQASLRSRLAENLARIRALAVRRVEIGLVPGGAGWSAVLRVPEVRSDEEWALAILDRGVAVQPGYFYDFARGAYLVSSLLPQPDEFSRGIDAVEELAATL